MACSRPGGFWPESIAGLAHYRHVNSSGNLFGDTFDLPYELPVWQYRSWILDTINGAGSSGSPRTTATTSRAGGAWRKPRAAACR